MISRGEKVKELKSLGLVKDHPRYEGLQEQGQEVREQVSLLQDFRKRAVCANLFPGTPKGRSIMLPSHIHSP